MGTFPLLVCLCRRGFPFGFFCYRCSCCRNFRCRNACRRKWHPVAGFAGGAGRFGKPYCPFVCGFGNACGATAARKVFCSFEDCPLLGWWRTCPLVPAGRTLCHRRIRHPCRFCRGDVMGSVDWLSVVSRRSAGRHPENDA